MIQLSSQVLAFLCEVFRNMGMGIVQPLAGAKKEVVVPVDLPPLRSDDDNAVVPSPISLLKLRGVAGCKVDQHSRIPVSVVHATEDEWRFAKRA